MAQPCSSFEAREASSDRPYRVSASPKSPWMFARMPRFCSTRARSCRLSPPSSRARRKFCRASATASVSRSIPPSVLRASPASTSLPARRAAAWLRRHSSRASADSPRWCRTTARRRSDSANTGCSPASAAAAMAASYAATASGMQPVRSRARASCSRSAARRTGARQAGGIAAATGMTATTALPGHVLAARLDGQQRVQPVDLYPRPQALERRASSQCNFSRGRHVAITGQHLREVALGSRHEQRPPVLRRAVDHLTQHRLGILCLPHHVLRHGEDPQVLCLEDDVLELTVHRQSALRLADSDFGLAPCNLDLGQPRERLGLEPLVAQPLGLPHGGVGGPQRLVQLPLLAVRDREIVPRLGDAAAIASLLVRGDGAG